MYVFMYIMYVCEPNKLFCSSALRWAWGGGVFFFSRIAEALAGDTWPRIVPHFLLDGGGTPRPLWRQLWPCDDQVGRIGSKGRRRQAAAPNAVGFSHLEGTRP